MGGGRRHRSFLFSDALTGCLSKAPFIPQRHTLMSMDLLNKVATTALLGFVVSSMMAMGVGFTVRQIIDALRDVRLVLLALLGNFVAMPLGALALDKILRLDEPLGVGLLLLGAAAGAPFLPKLTELAKGDLPFAVGIMVLLAIGTVGYLPLLPGVTVNSGKIAGWLFLLTLLPLAAGLALRARYAEVAARVKPLLDWVSNAILVPMVLLLAVANIDKILHIFGTRGILAGFLLIALGFGIGWMLGGPGSDRRRALALGTGQRNVAAALVVASESFSDPSVVIMVIVVTIVGLLTLLPLCHVLASYDFKQSTE
jgi:BASS family bile acid:Na+ symporter